MKPLLPSLLLALASVPAAQATILVPADQPTIQAGIDAALPGDTVLVAPGNYDENLDFLGKAITVRSQGGAAVTTIDGLGLGPTVVFHGQEGPDTVLEGFTVTGGVASSTPGGGISCLDLPSLLPSATPTIRACVITNNTSFAGGGGVGGSALLEDCTVDGNDAGISCGGGVWGAATLRRCLVTGNVAADGGGLYLLADGALVEDCEILENLAIDGARGGGVHAAPGLAGDVEVVVRRSLLSRNTSNGLVQASSRGGAVHVSAAAGVARLERCTILDNNAVASVGGDDYGGVFGPATIVDSIVRDNDANEIGATTVVTYSNVEGGAPGLGNVDATPLFLDRANGDLMLLPGSPGVDGGDPASPLDPDCTRADMGAFPLFQASVAVEAGTGLNPVCLQSLNYPVVGSTWSGRVDTSGLANPSFSLVLGYNSVLETPIPLTAIGRELIVNGMAPLLLVIGVPASAGFDAFSSPIPNQPNLVGFVGYLQAFVIGPGMVVLEACNALELKLGL